MRGNRHVAAALIIMPLLSLLGWWAAGHLAGEQPQPAREGMNYPLVEQSGCRYAGGACSLENVDVRLALAYLPAAEGQALEVRASLALDGVLLAVGDPAADPPPRPMTRRDAAGKHWVQALRRPPGAQDRIRLVARARGIDWYGEAGTAFLQPPDGYPVPR